MWDTLIVTPMTNILLLIYAFVGNFGIAIILFTILIKAATHPLMASQIKSSARMQELMQSEDWQKIQAKYKDDKEKLAQEQMRVYKEQGVNPLGSCLPTLIQFPVIIGLYQSINRVMGASPVQLIDLVRSITDPLWSWMGNVIPAASLNALLPINNHFLWMNLGQPERILTDILPFGGLPTLAIIVGLTTYIQTKLTVMPSASPNDQSAQMTQMMGIYMPLMLFWFSLNFASGLAVYFIASNLAGIAQYAALGKVNWRNLLNFGGKPQPAVVKASATKKSKK
ncbi:MAG: YidC/Oxa1 family membrane protein insertase [Anaerolineae bacterium]|nr:YidC/Oxa1 family membrane protein insertase [Anaerolineae bacterium]